MKRYKVIGQGTSYVVWDTKALVSVARYQIDAARPANVASHLAHATAATLNVKKVK